MEHCDNAKNMRTTRSEASYLPDKCLPLRYDGWVWKVHVPPKLPRQKVGRCDTAIKVTSLSSSNYLFAHNTIVLFTFQYKTKKHQKDTAHSSLLIFNQTNSSRP